MLWVVLVTTVVTILRFTITPTTALVCFRWVLSCGCVIGHGIGRKVIPAKMARLAESQSLE